MQKCKTWRFASASYSLTRSLNVYRNICKYAIRIINSLGLELDYIDVGGGYFGDKPNAPTYKEYVDTIYSSLLEEGIDVSKNESHSGTRKCNSCFTF